MTSIKPLARSGGTISARLQGEKRPLWRRERRRRLPCGTCAGGKVAELLSWQPPSFQPPLAGSDRCVKPRGRLESRGFDPFLLVFCREGLIPVRSEKKEGAGKRGRRESKRDQSPPPNSPRCVINVTLQVESSGNFFFFLPTGRRAGCRDRWLTEEAQLRDL